jgi:hypothetical protein
MKFDRTSRKEKKAVIQITKDVKELAKKAEIKAKKVKELAKKAEMKAKRVKDLAEKAKKQAAIVAKEYK